MYEEFVVVLLVADCRTPDTLPKACASLEMLASLPLVTKRVVIHHECASLIRRLIQQKQTHIHNIQNKIDR